MERTIKFKAKRLDNKGWVEGDLLHSYENSAIIVPIEGGGAFSVDPSTVCQFTGLKDREGNDIFEGDLLAEDKIAVFEVGYTKCGFACSYLFHKHFMYDLYKISKTHVVCGSKFDRKEEK